MAAATVMVSAVAGRVAAVVAKRAERMSGSVEFIAL